MSLESFEPRDVAPDLRQRYEQEGWWDGTTLGSMLLDGLARNGSREFRVWSRQCPYRGTFDDVRALAMRVAGGLRRRGVAAGDVVAFQLPNWVEAAATFYGLASLGAVLLPVVPTYGTKELRFILRAAGARAFVAPATFGRRNYAEEVEALGADLPELEHVILVGSAIPPGTIPFADVADAAPIDRPMQVDSRVPAVIGFTSGTSAEPKGAVHTHESICAETRFHMAATLPRGGRSPLIASPISHVTGMLLGLLVPPLRGEPVHFIDAWDPPFVLDAMLSGDLSAGSGAAVFITSLLNDPAVTPEHIEKISHIALGGSPTSLALVDRCEALGIAVTRGYGSTEHPSISSAAIEEERALRNRFDGRLLAGVEARTIDLNDGRPLPPGETGEIVSRGPDLFAGYLDGSLTRAAVDEEGWFATGDIGVVNPEGWVAVTDRRKDIIIRGGENISAAEVEQALMAMDGVADVAVVGAPDDRLGERVAAFVTVRPGASPPQLDAVRRRLESLGMAKHKWPQQLHVVTDLPRTPSGKVKKYVLRQELGHGRRVAHPYQRGHLSEGSAQRAH